MSYVIVETDSTVLMHAMKGRDYDQSAIGAIFRPCSVNPLATEIEGDWGGLRRILTCKGFNPLQSLSNLFKPSQTEQGLMERGEGD